LATDIPEIPSEVNTEFEKILSTRKDASITKTLHPYPRYIRCGKKNCKCASGKGHGPYWYVKIDGKDKYLGKNLPSDFNIQNKKFAIRFEIDALQQQYKKIKRLQDELRKEIADFTLKVQTFDFEEIEELERQERDSKEGEN